MGGRLGARMEQAARKDEKEKKSFKKEDEESVGDEIEDEA